VATVFIPSLLRPYTGGQERLAVEGRTLRQVIDALDRAHPGVKERLLLDADRLRPEIVAAIDGVTEHFGMIEPVAEHSEIHFIPAVSGGE
jgi:molybdopterin synthase sulfur carrier subunit